MVTTKYMERKLNGATIRQNHKTAWLNVTDMLRDVNAKRKLEGMPEKILQNYLSQKSAKEFMETLKREECVPKVLESKSGRYGGTWVHPLLFLDIAMWVSPEFKYKVLKWLQDELLYFRDLSGDEFKEGNKALNDNFKSEFENNALLWSRIGSTIAQECCVKKNANGKGYNWERATEEQLQLRVYIYEYIIDKAEECGTVMECIIASMYLARKKLDRMEKREAIRQNVKAKH